MPFWIGDGPLTVVAARDLGELGPSETQPVTIEWRWYYHLPGLAIWILVAALLIVAKENRDWQAWTILVPAILLTTVIWPLIVNLTGDRLQSLFCFTSDERADFAFNCLIGGWTAVWLAAPRLARCRGTVAFSLVLVFLLLSGTIAHAAAFSGIRSHFPSTLAWWKYISRAIVWYGTCAVGMLLGMTLAAIRCRNTYRPRRFLAWMAIGILSADCVGTVVYVCLLPLDRISVPMLLFGSAVMSLGVAVFAYLVNLPFLYLAHRCPCYRNRLHRILRLPDRT